MLLYMVKKHRAAKKSWKLQPWERQAIEDALRRGEKGEALAAEFNVTSSTITRIRKLILNWSPGGGPRAPLWKGQPKIGTVWRKRVGSTTQTRHVVDRTLGAHVVYVAGRFTRFATRYTCTIENWNAWATDAKRVDGYAKN